MSPDFGICCREADHGCICVPGEQAELCAPPPDESAAAYKLVAEGETCPAGFKEVEDCGRCEEIMEAEVALKVKHPKTGHQYKMIQSSGCEAHIDNRDHFSTVILTALSRGQKTVSKYGTILTYSVYFSCIFCRLQA